MILNTITDLDIDECANNVSLCNHYCNNTEGSFICSCDEGYSLSENNFTCIGEI